MRILCFRVRLGDERVGIDFLGFLPRWVRVGVVAWRGYFRLFLFWGGMGELGWLCWEALGVALCLWNGFYVLVVLKVEIFLSSTFYISAGGVLF